ncbi:LPPG:FO 2-phospho-L-lactate transferase CofD/UPF0052 [Scheffersomyces coipomensis]|uniref:LPPG:FO 2-phospho-L-lactate transferase CofD/UPF0052 n=1 Tax=Scheffersomyces coipomensis TaxID=1788519 RepID=UPI00315D6217
MTSEENFKLVVLSGGTATNELVSVFKSIAPTVSYILPISDNGGSTSEIIRVIGGPAIGDIRSRLTRLIPPHKESLRVLLSFRLSSDPAIAKDEWNSIVDGTHKLWSDINTSTKEIFRAFFIHIHVELLKRSKYQYSQSSSKKQFRYELANIGNLFLTGVRLFVGSLDSAIELFCKLAEIDSSIEVLPCINTNFTYHISALLENGLIITGQSQISHPSHREIVIDVYPPPIDRTRPSSPTEDMIRTSYFGTPALDGINIDVPINEVALSRNSYLVPESVDEEDDDEEELGNVPQYTHPELKKSQLHFNKTDIEPLLSPIKRIFYVSPYGQEIRPTAPHTVTSCIANTNVLIYSIGSLMTSIVPIVILKGVGKAIAENKTTKKKILLLNGCFDRETFGMAAVDFLNVIIQSARYSEQSDDADTVDWSNYISHLVFMNDSNIHVDKEYLESTKNIKCVEVKRQGESDFFDTNSLQEALKHIVYNGLD